MIFALKATHFFLKMPYKRRFSVKKRFFKEKLEHARHARTQNLNKENIVPVLLLIINILS